MRLNNRVRIIVDEPRRPQRGVKVVPLGLELGCEAPIEHNRADLQRIGKCGSHRPNLRTEEFTLSVRKLG